MEANGVRPMGIFGDIDQLGTQVIRIEHCVKKNVFHERHDVSTIIAHAR